MLIIFIGRFDLEISDELNLKVTKIEKDPVLNPGKLGCFDDNGVSPSSYVLAKNNVHHLYYIGWKPRSTTRFSLVAGLAISHDGKNFKRHSMAPLLYQNDLEPLSILTAPWVILDNDIFRMWYVSGVEWINEDLPKYNIKYAESIDGINWDHKINEKTPYSLSRSNDKNAWDSQMVEYSCVTKFKNYLLMFYNGNQYGKTGIGLSYLKLK